MNKIIISDPTLRDGSHAINHKLTEAQIKNYCLLADKANIPIVEVGHGNGLGASSLLVGESLLSDQTMLQIAREHLKKAKLGIHVIPGFATIKRDLELALSYGVDVVRVATHCTEADLAERHIEFVAKNGKEVYGVLMMSHMVSSEELLKEAKKMEYYGSTGIIIMDSAGTYLMEDVKERINKLVSNLSITVGFHGHNNLGLGVANSIIAIEEGASIIDATSCAFGAGAGNTQLEVLISVLEKMNYKTDIDLKRVFNLAQYVDRNILEKKPFADPISIVSGMAGVFSGFKNPVLRTSKHYAVDPLEVFMELGKRGILAGQEDIILEVVKEIANKK